MNFIIQNYKNRQDIIFPINIITTVVTSPVYIRSKIAMIRRRGGGGGGGEAPPRMGFPMSNMAKKLS